MGTTFGYNIMKFLSLVLCFYSLTVSASDPAIRIVVPYSAGGPADIIAKLVQKSLIDRTDRTVVVTYSPGASGEIGAATVANSRSDTDVLLLASASFASSNIGPNTKYDMAQLTPIAYLGHIPLVLVVNKNFPARTIDDFRKLPKDQVVKYASSGLNTSTHLTGLVFSQGLPGTYVHVPYKGIAQGMPNLLAGITDMAFVSWTMAAPYIETGQLIPVAVVSEHRLPQLASVPTFGEIGFKNFGFKTWFMLLAGPNVSSGVIDLVQHSLIQELSTNRSYKDIGLEFTLTDILNSSAVLQKEVKLYKEFYQQ